MINFDLEIDVELSVLKEDINSSFRGDFNIESFSVGLSEQIHDIDLLFQKEFIKSKKISFDIEIDPDSSVYDNDFRKRFGIYSFNIFCEDNNIGNVNGEFNDLFNEQKLNSNVEILNNLKPRILDENISNETVEEQEELEELFPFKIELCEASTVFDYDFRKYFNIHNFETILDRDKTVNDLSFEEYFQVNLLPECNVIVNPKNNLSFNIELDEQSSVFDYDFRKRFGIKTFNIFCKNTNIGNLNEEFNDLFYDQKLNSPLNIDILNNLKPLIVNDIVETVEEVIEVETVEEVQEVETVEEVQEVETVEEVIEEVQEVETVEEQEEFPFGIELCKDGLVFDYDFRKQFNIHNFKICLDRSKNVDDLIFEDRFKVDLEPIYDYDIIDNLKRNLNSRKIVTRDEVPENEPDIFSIDKSKKTQLSLDESLEENKSVIKENSFYKIVEVNPDIEQLPIKVDDSYKEEVEEQLSSMESKYEDLLQKTKDDYESKLGKMINDFSDFRNHITQQVTRMSFIASSSAGGGAVNILDMDDVDPSQLEDGRTLIWDSESNKFKLEASKPQSVQIYEVDQQIVDNGYVDLDIEANPDLYDLSTVELNGLANYNGIHYNFISTTRINISLIGVEVGDFIRVIYTRK